VSGLSYNFKLSYDRCKLSCVRFGLSCDRFGLSCDRFRLSCDRFRLSCDRFRLSCNRFGLSCDRFRLSCDRFGLRSCDRFRLSCNRFGLSCDRFGLSRDRFGLSFDTFVPGVEWVKVQVTDNKTKQSYNQTNSLDLIISQIFAIYDHSNWYHRDYTQYENRNTCKRSMKIFEGTGVVWTQSFIDCHS
jgi:hypothetical protein